MEDIPRIAVVGFGLVGKRHAEILRRSPEFTVAAVVEPQDAGSIEASELGIPVYATLADMFDEFVPDGIVLATPTPLHVEQGLACIAKGCPLLVEKPIAVTAADARALTEAAAAAGVPLLVGHHRRHNGMVKAAKQAITSGVIGDVRSVQATCWFYKPDRYFEIAPWRTKKGAGPISVNLVHDVDLLRHFCGEVSSVRAVSVPSARVRKRGSGNGNSGVPVWHDRNYIGVRQCRRSLELGADVARESSLSGDQRKLLSDRRLRGWLVAA